MASLTIQNRKLQFIRSFLKVEDSDVIAKFENLLLKAREKELKQYVAKPLTKKVFNQIMDSAENDSKLGKLTKAEDVLKEIEKW